MLKVPDNMAAHGMLKSVQVPVGSDRLILTLTVSNSKFPSAEPVDVALHVESSVDSVGGELSIKLPSSATVPVRVKSRASTMMVIDEPV